MAPKDEAELQQMLVTALDHPPYCPALSPWSGKVLNCGESCCYTHRQSGSSASGYRYYPFSPGPWLPGPGGGGKLSPGGYRCRRSKRPFCSPDEETILEYARKTKKLVTIEDHACQGGFGSAVLELLARQGVADCRVAVMGYGDSYIEHGTRNIYWQRINSRPPT